MSILSNLKPNIGSTKNRKRIGRGQGSGQGKTAGKGEKGQTARSGGKIRRGFEGGQMPLQRRVPKRGFYSHFRKEYAVLTLEGLNQFMPEGGDVNLDTILEHGFVNSNANMLKIVGNDEVKAKYNVIANKISAAARKSIEKAGGTINIIETRSKSARVTLGKIHQKFFQRDAGVITVKVDDIKSSGLIPKYKEEVEIIAVGNIAGKYNLEAHKISRAARKKIEVLGGKVNVLTPEFNYRKIDFNDLRKWFPKGGDVTTEMLMKKGVIKKDQKVKLIDKGRLYGSYNVKLNKISRAAIIKIENNGGQAELID